jgi:hypothetical protein
VIYVSIGVKTRIVEPAFALWLPVSCFFVIPILLLVFLSIYFFLASVRFFINGSVFLKYHLSHIWLET